MAEILSKHKANYFRNPEYLFLFPVTQADDRYIEAIQSVSNSWNLLSKIKLIVWLSSERGSVLVNNRLDFYDTRTIPSAMYINSFKNPPLPWRREIGCNQQSKWLNSKRTIVSGLSSNLLQLRSTVTNCYYSV